MRHGFSGVRSTYLSATQGRCLGVCIRSQIFTYTDFECDTISFIASPSSTEAPHPSHIISNNGTTTHHNPSLSLTSIKHPRHPPQTQSRMHILRHIMQHAPHRHPNNLHRLRLRHRRHASARVFPWSQEEEREGTTGEVEKREHAAS